MAKKRKQQKNGLYQHSQNHKKGVSKPEPASLTTDDRDDVNEKMSGLGEELLDDGHVQDGKENNKKSRKPQGHNKEGVNETVTEQAVPFNDSTDVCKSDTPISETSNIRDGSKVSANDTCDSNDMYSSGNVPTGLHREDGSENVELPETVVLKFIKTIAISVAQASLDWLERHKLRVPVLKNHTIKACDHVRMRVQHAKPVIFRWIMHIRNLMLLLCMAWLDCSLRGTVSLLHMGTTSFFLIMWCSVLSLIAMVGVGKFLVMLIVASAAGLFLGFIFTAVSIGIGALIFLWFYGSFWTTGLVIFLGGLAFGLSHDRVALFITSVYAAYCAWNYVGWLGLVLSFNLSFISSDALLFFLRNIINEERSADSSPDQSARMRGQSSTQTGAADPHAEHGPGEPLTSGSASEMTSEDEVVRLLNCMDHYAALGLFRFENIDASVIKREYRKKAMLVHPDKNMGNEKAAEAFKKLQNAYDVLLDSLKRKEYDDELRREELLNYFHKFQDASHENKGHASFTSSFAHMEADGEGPPGESRQIACRKCGFFHLWIYTKKLKSSARWCQECNDFHQAKDGDGWVEQSSQPFFFGILQKVEAPSAYICADGKVYDATEWYICQGLRCPANAHKPTFQVNTNVATKNSHFKGSTSGQRGGTSSLDMECDTMTEDEFFEWLQNAMQSGVFENFPSNTSDGSSGFNPKGGGSGSSKRKKKGKKQR
ncbi:Molecular chaperone (DnaJ superfamily) [Handroanthus impetiginosus]|uniref:Molecular chaperone (DnaJ superfamily) n=1 Tax=Handroanthus impetiginosus TaxID=429701 RepID=A0A2G9I0I8_9LAMI|nr:Molecular chaperone (DnaJ superfamily) [Handroanthus impetiginosus]